MDRMMAAVVNMSAAASAEAVSSCANIAIILDAALLASVFVALISLVSLISLRFANRLREGVPVFA